MNTKEINEMYPHIPMSREELELDFLRLEVTITRNICLRIINEYYATHKEKTLFTVLNSTNKSVGGLDCRCTTVRAQSLPFNQH